MEGIICSRCGASNTEGSKFCSQCAAPLQVKEVEAPPPPPLSLSSPVGGGVPAAPPPPAPRPQFGGQQFPPPSPAQQVPPQPGGLPAPQQQWPPPQSYVAPPQKQRVPLSKQRKLVLIISCSVLATIILVFGLGSLAYCSLAGGAQETDHFRIGSDQVPSVSYALGEDRKLQSLNTGGSGGITMLTAVYDVPGNGQGGDMRAYFDYLCSVDGFVTIGASGNDSVFDERVGSTLQVQRNSVEEGYLIVVQVDYDTEGYTVTMMHGEGQASGAAGTGGGNNGDTGGTGTSGTGTGGDTGNSGTGNSDTSNGDYSSLLPAGEPESTNILNDWKIATYADGTVSVADGQGIIQPDGTIYINGNKNDSLGPIELPDDGSSIELNGGMVYAAGGELYVVANGSVLYIDADNTASAWDAP